MAIYITSDLHFCHDKDFVYEPRGFKTIEEMNKAIVENWNSIITEEDDVYILGDLMLNDNETGLKLISSLKGKLHIVRGNHDTRKRIKLYGDLDNVVEVRDVIFDFRYKGFTLYMSHYPTLTFDGISDSSLRKISINLFGHTHQKENFFKGFFFMYHVGVDSHNCTPVLLDNIIEEVIAKKKENPKI